MERGHCVLALGAVMIGEELAAACERRASDGKGVGRVWRWRQRQPEFGQDESVKPRERRLGCRQPRVARCPCGVEIGRAAPPVSPCRLATVSAAPGFLRR